ncbi:MAG: PmoA family protein [Flavobacteriaceae bacterium]
MKKISGLFFLVALLISCQNQPSKKESNSENTMSEAIIKIVPDDGNQKVDVLVEGSLFTSYLYTDAYYKPVLYPLITASGKSLTRGFPVSPKAGERVDHPHHVGHWLNYGDVNGLDFWNHSDAIPMDKKAGYGTVFHSEYIIGEDQKSLTVKTEWKAPSGEVLLEENTVFEFSVQAANRIIDRTTTLLAKTEVSLKDNKEGFVAVRVTRALEHPSDKPELFTDANGIPSEVKVLNNDGVTGSYLSANGLTGEAVWGTRAPWVALNGVVEDQAVAITILDHPDNLGYPTYWHARGYGLFAANPLGQEVFSEGAEILNASLSSGESLTFKYRIVVSDQNMDATSIAPFEQF